MGEILALRSGTFLPPCRVRTAAWIFAWCLLVHGTAGPGYPQTDSTPQRGSHGNTFRVKVVGTTNTQAVLAYSAPDSKPCTVQVSESTTMSPLVHDVDSTLFADANSDTRTSSIVAGASRIVVLGARLSQAGLDGRVYSRALQTNTSHHYRVACGSSVDSGSFTTANIPFNMTYQDVPQLDSANPGTTVVPTLVNDRTQTIVDPHTGALIRRVSLPADSVSDGGGGTGPFMYYSGFTRVCSDNLQAAPDGTHGYLCSFAQGDGGYGTLYYIIPSTGEARYLGHNPWGAAMPVISAPDAKFYVSSGRKMLAYTYAGNYMAASSGTAAKFSSTVVINTSLNAAMSAFDGTFPSANFPCSAGAPTGDYSLLKCSRGVQDTYAWLGVLRVSTGAIIAAMRLDDNIQCRWCALHQASLMYDAPAISITSHALVGQSPPLGGGPYVTTYTGGSTLAIGSTKLAVSGEPSCAACGADSTVALARGEDTFAFSDTGEKVRIVTKTSPTSWVITATRQSHAPGSVLTASCSYTPLYWKFLADAHGSDTTNTNLVADSHWPVGGHDDWITGLRITESTGYPIVVGDLVAMIDTPITRIIGNSPLFAGKIAECYGDACVAHPSLALDQPWFTDFFAWSWAGLNGVFSPVAGQLYKYANTSYLLGPKHFAIAGVVGSRGSYPPHSFLDVSPAVLSPGAGDAYKYCIANSAGECYAGSVAGEVYANIPGSPGLSCTQGSAVCFGNFGGNANGALQIRISGTQTRVITNGLGGLRSFNDYPTAKALHDGSWLLFTMGDPTTNKPSHLMMAKLPPFTADDSVDRTTFVRAPISIVTPQGQGIAAAAVEFGYLEQGAPSQHYCTSRREACVAVASTVTDASPFWYVSTDAYTRASCATSCTITLPVLPAHVAYYQVKFYDAQGALVGLGERGVSVEAAAITPGGVPANAPQ
jgi:hypothetical protein